MTDITICLVLDLQPRGSTRPFGPVGPTFHRWLPDGEHDAIVLDSSRAGASPVRAWFERRAINSGGWLRFNWEGKEFDPSIMARQAPLDAGYLCADAVFAEVDDRVTAALQRLDGGAPTPNDPDADSLERFGRSVRDRMIPALQAFIHRLRIQFGQHWLRELAPWDSRRGSLGSYFDGLNARWYQAGDHTKREFRPTAAVVRTVAQFNLSGQFDVLTQDDWEYLKATASTPPELTLGHEILVEAHRFYDTGQMHRALVEATTAVELLVNDCFRKAYDKQTKAGGRAQSLAGHGKIGIADRIVALCARDPSVERNLVEDALRAIDLRNKIVHEGWRAPSEENLATDVQRLIALGRALVGLERFKLPRANAGGCLLAAEDTAALPSQPPDS
jgi:hypothetical protein